MPLPQERPQISPPTAICIIRLSAIGDCCHTVPIVRTVQAAWPETSITWIIGNTEYGLLKGIDGVEFITLDKSRGFAGYLDLRRRLTGRRFPVLLHMHASMRANIASLMVRADQRIGFDRARARDRQWLFTNRKIPARPRQHVMDGLFGFVETLGITERTVRWGIPVDPEDLEFANELRHDDRPLCVISPCTSQRFRNYRNWRPKNYVAVAEYLHDKYRADVVLTGSSTDVEMQYGRQIESGVSFPVANLIGQTSLKRLLAVLGAADLLICPDSGPAHMATAVGTPVIGLYATSNTHRTGPYFSQQLVVDEYPEAVCREFDKPVGALRWGQRVRDPDAMDLIKVDRVLNNVDTVLGAERGQGPSGVEQGQVAPHSGLG